MRWGPARGEAVAGRVPPAHLLDLAEIPRARNPPRGHPGRLPLLPTEANPSAYPARRMMGPAGCCLLLAAAACWLLLAGCCLMPAYCWQLLLAAARR